MQSSIKTILAVAAGMATFASAAAAEGLATVNSATPSAAPANIFTPNGNSSFRFRCCAFKGCKVCADYGPIDSCSPCGVIYHWCCAK